ncbi:MAG: hypothetical protein HYZ49_19210 [Chloroflexi bacterium]|nr:hypothetical protein [Chloroflexota bacterium]
MSIHILRERATPEQIAAMLADWGVLIKVAVDVQREIMAGGGEMHADSEAVLLADGSRQSDLWGANWYPASNEIRFEAIINLRSRDGNTKTEVQNPAIRAKMENIIRQLLAGDS